MTYRLFVMFLFAGLVALALPTSADAQGSVPRTPWGDPDLSGAWTNATMTPLQRPIELGDREYLTPKRLPFVRARSWSGRAWITGREQRPVPTTSSGWSEAT